MPIILFIVLLAGILLCIFCGKKFSRTGKRLYLVLLIVCVIISLAALFLIVATVWFAWAVSVQPPD